MKFKKKGRQTETQREDTKNPAYGAGADACAVDRGDSPVAGKEETMYTDKAEVREGEGKRAGQRQWLIMIAAAILAVLVIASSFVLGYFIGHGSGVTDTLAKGAQTRRAASARLGGGLTQTQGGGTAAGRVREMIRSGEAELVRGDVTAVESGRVTLQTASGSAAIALTDSTRYIGRGSRGEDQGSGGGANKIEKGQKVTVIVKRDSSGNMQALAVRVTPQGARL